MKAYIKLYDIGLAKTLVVKGSMSPGGAANVSLGDCVDGVPLLSPLLEGSINRLSSAQHMT